MLIPERVHKSCLLENRGYEMKATGIITALLFVGLLNFSPCLLAQESGKSDLGAVPVHGKNMPPS